MSYTYGKFKRTEEYYITDTFSKGDLVEYVYQNKRGVVLEVTLEEDDTYEMHEWVHILWYNDGTKKSYLDSQYGCLKNLSKKSE